jgi:chloramphenicol O-acetyltransferase
LECPEICSKYDLDTPSYGQFHEEIHKFEFLENEVSKEVLDKVEEYISDL